MKKTWQIVSVVVAVLALFITVWQTLLTRQSTKHELGGTLSALVGERQVAIGETADVVVFTTDGVVNLSDIDVVPTFKNVSKYTVHDILAEYVVSGNVALSYADFYSSLSQGGRTTVQRNERELYAHRQTEQPFVSLSVTGSEAHSTIETSVTYDGAMIPFQHTTNLLVMKVAKRSSQSLEQWKQQCRATAQRRLDGKIADIYYCASAYVSKELGVSLASANSASTEQPKPKTVQQPKKDQPKEIAKKKPVDEQKLVINRPEATDLGEEKCDLLVRSEYDKATGKLTVYFKPSEHQRTLVFWNKYKMNEKDDEIDYYYWLTKSNPGDSVYVMYSPIRDGKHAVVYNSIDVMEEDSSLLKNVVVKGNKVRNRTGKTIVCRIETEDGYRYHAINGKWYGYKCVRFGSDVKHIQVAAVAKDKRKELSLGNWLFMLLILFIGCMIPCPALYFIVKNGFNLRNAVEDFDDKIGFAKFWNWFWIIVTFAYLIFCVIVIIWNIVMSTPL